jgi:hypothetical protein
MFRAITSTCLALMILLTGARALAGKPLIAVLGLEVKDESGTPTPADTDVAKKLTEGLRGRAKLGSGPYQIAGNSDKELIDEKLLKNCDSEADKCMAQIGNDLGADWLLYGKIEKKGTAYVVTMKLLDVHQKRTVKSSTDPIPLSQAANDVALSEWAQKIYAKLTGEKSAGSIIVKVTNTDRGTLLVNGEEKGSFTNGTGTIGGLEENRYKLTVEAPGYKPYDDSVSVKAGESTTKTVTLEKTAPVVTPGGNGGGVIEPPGGGGIVVVPPGGGGGARGGGEGGHGSAGWKGVFVGSVVVGLASGGLWIYGSSKVNQAHDDLQKGCAYAMSTWPSSCPGSAASPGLVSTYNARGDRGKLYTIIGGVGVGVGGTLALVALYEGFIAKNDDSGKEHADKGHRVHRDRFVVTPIIAPNGTGATLQFDW